VTYLRHDIVYSSLMNDYKQAIEQYYKQGNEENVPKLFSDNYGLPLLLSGLNLQPRKHRDMAASRLQKDEYKELRVRKCDTYHGTPLTLYQ